MESILDNYKKTGSLSHAYLIIGAVDEIIGELKKIIEKIQGASLDNNPDVFIENYLVFGVGESRKLRDAGHKKSICGGKRFFIVGAHSFTEEAENALLKTLEEPLQDSHFFLAVPNIHAVLPTIKSRMTILQYDSLNKCEDGGICEKIIEKNIAERIIFLEELFDKCEDTEDIKKMRITGKNILKCFEKFIAKELKEKKWAERGGFAKKLEEVLKMEKYMMDISSSPRLILEYLSFILPHKGD